MGRPCSVCESPNRAQIDMRLSAGERVATVANELSISESAARRHVHAHLRRSLLNAMREPGAAGSSDLLERLKEALDDVTAVRTAALLSGNSTTLLRAATTTERLVTALADRLGVDDLSVTDELHDAQTLALAVGRAARGHPAVGLVVAHHLRDLGSDTNADALESLANASAAASKEHQ